MSRRNKEQRVNYHLFPLPPFKGEIKAALSCLLPPFNPPPPSTLLFTPVALHQPPIRPRLLICSHRSSLIGDLHIHHLYAVLTDSRVMPPTLHPAPPHAHSDARQRYLLPTLFVTSIVFFVLLCLRLFSAGLASRRYCLVSCAADASYR